MYQSDFQITPEKIITGNWFTYIFIPQNIFIIIL